MIELDLLLFHWLNRGTIHPWLDRLMPIVTSWTSWGVAIGAGVIYLLAFRGDRGRRAVLAMVLAVALGDSAAAHILKPAFHRLRPCHAAIDARVVVRCGGRYGFPSNHATNGAAASAALGTFYPVTLAITVPVALLVGWSRVYLGVHYPGDVAAGFLFGAFTGILVAVVIRRQGPRRLPES